MQLGLSYGYAPNECPCDRGPVPLKSSDRVPVGSISRNGMLAQFWKWKVESVGARWRHVLGNLAVWQAF